MLLATGVAFASSLSGCIAEEEDTEENMAQINPTWHSIEAPDNEDVSDVNQIKFTVIPELGVALFFQLDWISTGGGTSMSVVPLAQMGEEIRNYE